MQVIPANIFSADGLGWGILFSLLTLSLILFLWFKEKRFSYETIIIKKLTKEEYSEFSITYPSDIYYAEEENPYDQFYWVFGCEDKEVGIELFEFYPSEKYNISKSLKRWERDSYKKIELVNRQLFPLNPGEFGAFLLSTNHNAIPRYRIELNIEGRKAVVDISSNMRYGRIADNKKVIKMKQGFVSFVKSMF